MKSELLLVDLGNTRVKWATSGRRGSIRAVREHATARLSPKWIRAMARKYPRHHLILASVVPKWIPAFERAFRGRVLVVSGRLRSLVGGFLYPKPSELGADRIAAAVAARAGGLFPCIIVACGTATAFTVLDLDGKLCGGAIAPGLPAQMSALLGATAQLPATTLRMPSSPLAKSTREAIRAGVLLNFQGGINEIIRRLSEALPGPATPRVILTGGNARYLVEHLETAFQLRPLLVLEGLRIIGMETAS